MIISSSFGRLLSTSSLSATILFPEVTIFKEVLIAVLSFEEAKWRKSSRSVADGACVEVALVESEVLIRDSKHPSGLILKVTADAWRSLIRAIKTDPIETAQY
jgi:hypothetical protein